MKIGLFDSGFGGLQTLKYLKEYFPQEDFLFLADSKRVPYGDKSKDFIKQRTITCIDFLFDQGCELVLIACNTAVAAIHEHWFEIDRERRLIGVTRSGVKQLIRHAYDDITVFCTQATHDFQVYQSIYTELGGTGKITTIPLPELVPMLENPTIDTQAIAHYIDQYKQQVLANSDCLVMGCTHYPLIIDIFREKFPAMHLIDPGRSSIFTLKKRIEQRRNKLKQESSDIHQHITIYCTGDNNKFQTGAQAIRKECGQVESVEV